MAPAILLFQLYALVLVTMLFFTQAFYLVMAVLSGIVACLCNYLVITSMIGAFRLRAASGTDWHALLSQLPGEERSGVVHIVLLPNYMESEGTLKETLDNLALSRLAVSSVHVVLAMECREGAVVREKAERLVNETKHLFADIIIAYHPVGLPGEVPGKSSNIQWAFREALRHYGPKLTTHDSSKVFFTVSDSDSLWHPQYFSCLTYQALMQTPEERNWKMWQPSILLLRNISSVPALTRTSGHATLICELSAMATQVPFPAEAHSAYSMTLALASHPDVDGWDVDVIAEDHHMFRKCYFAALWESAQASKAAATEQPIGLNAAIVPRVRVEPVYLPVVGFLAESSAGYVASLWARFLQARRRTQGVAELGYVLLHYSRLVTTVGFFKLPWRTHVAIFSIALRICLLHIATTALCLSAIMATLTMAAPTMVSFVRSGGIARIVLDSAGIFEKFHDGWGNMSIAQQSLPVSACQMFACIVLASFACLITTCDLLEGRHYVMAKSAAPLSPRDPYCAKHYVMARSAAPLSPMQDMSSAAVGKDTSRQPEERASRPEAEALEQEGVDPPPQVQALREDTRQVTLGKRGWMWCFFLFVQIASDFVGIGCMALTLFGTIPMLLAGWSLLCRGSDVGYNVTMRPE